MGYRECWSLTMENSSTTTHLGLLFGVRNQELLLITRPPADQQTGRGHKPILAQDHQASARGGKGIWLKELPSVLWAY